MLLALFRGLYCPFCRRQMAQLSPVAERLRARGAETVGIVATAAERARRYAAVHSFRYPLAADPALTTHRSYGLPHIARDDEAHLMIEAAARRVASDLGIEIPGGEARAALDRADGFERVPSDAIDREQHQIQMVGQFLIDRDGYVRWCRVEDRATYARFPTAQELIALAEG